MSSSTALAQGPYPLGGEFRSNTYTVGYQANSSVAMDDLGGFVVVWEGRDADDSVGVYVQRYGSNGTPQGGQTRANTYTADTQWDPDIAMDADGDFVVTWASRFQEGPEFNFGVYARRFSASGVPQGSEFHVNTSAAGTQWYPKVAMDADGNFVIAWRGPDSDSDGIFARRYTAAGLTDGPEFRVNTYTADAQREPEIAMSADGDFVVTWSSWGQDGFANGVYAQRYGASGGSLGAEFRVNPSTAGNERYASVAMDDDGDFAVTWMQSDGSAVGVFAQRYTAAGTPDGPAFRVNSFTEGNQLGTSVDMDADGDFVVTWYRIKTEEDRDVYVQQFNAAGVPQGPETLVNTFTTGRQESPRVALDGDGDFVVTWTDWEQDGDSLGVYAQRYSARPVVSEPDVQAMLSLTVFPNPVGDDGALVRFEVPGSRPVRVAVYDSLGREVAVLLDRNASGEQAVNVDTSDWPAGMYVVRVEALGHVSTSRLIVAQ